MANRLDKTGLAYYHSKIIANVSMNLTNCTSNGGEKALNGGQYVCDLKPIAGHVLQNVTVTMGGVDITDQVFSGYSGGYVTESQVSAMIAEALAEYGDGDTETYG